jgi:hypothetical protein
VAVVAGGIGVHARDVVPGATGAGRRRFVDALVGRLAP